MKFFKLKALAISAICIAGMPIAALSQTVNLLKNPSFETDVIYQIDTEKKPDCWSYIQNYPNIYTWDASLAFEGIKSLKIKSTGAKGGSSLTLTGITGSTNYTLSFYYKVEDITKYNSIVAYIEEYNAANSRIATQSASVLPSNTAWSRISKSFTTQSATTKLIVFCQINPKGTPTDTVKTWIDAAQLEQNSTASDFVVTDDGMPFPRSFEENLVMNPSLELWDTAVGRPSNWSYQGGSVWARENRTSFVAFHNQSMRLVSPLSGGYIINTNKITVQPSTNYTLSAFYKTNITTSGPRTELKVEFYNAANQRISGTYLSTALEKNTFQRVVLPFTTPSTCNKVEVIVFPKIVNSVPTDSIWIDAVQLQRGTYPTAFIDPQTPDPVYLPEDTINLIVNPSFETDVIWTNEREKLPDVWNYITSYSNSYIWSSDNFKYGNKSLQITSYSSKSGANQEFPVSANSNYSLSFYYKTLQPQDIYVVQGIVKEFDASNTLIATTSFPIYPPSTGWYKCKGSLTTNANTAKVQVLCEVSSKGTPQSPVISWIDGMLFQKGLAFSEFFITYDGVPNPLTIAQNLVHNPSFEIVNPLTNIPSDFRSYNLSYNMKHSSESSVSFDGSKSLKIVSYEKVANIRSEVMPVEPSTVYTMSSYMNYAATPSTPAPKAELSWVAWDSAMVEIGYGYNAPQLVDTGWQRVAYTFTTPNNAKYLSCNFRQNFINSPNDSDIAYIDAVQVQKGSYPTAFQVPQSAPISGVRTGRFAYYVSGQDIDSPLRKQGGQIITPSEVESVYGTVDGFTIFSDGIDICSQAFANKCGYPKSLKPGYQDLSSNWPNVSVAPGTVAIDPTLGRFALSAGIDKSLNIAIHEGFGYTGFGVPGFGEVCVQGNYAYIPSGEGDFQVYDLTNRVKPQIVGNLPVSFNRFAAVQGNYAYLIQNGLRVIAISNPAKPIWANKSGAEVWTPSQGGSASIIRVNGNYAYVTVTGSTYGFYVLNISNPLQVTELAYVNVQYTGGASELFVNGNLAYVGKAGRYNSPADSLAGGACIVDISNPSNPVIVGTYSHEPGETAEDLPFLIGNKGSTLIFATNLWEGHPARVVFIDAATPSTPVKRGEYVFTDRTSNVFLKRASSSSDYVYITDCTYDGTQASVGASSAPTHLTVLNVANVSAPVLVNDLTQTAARYRYSSVVDTVLYITDYNYGIRCFSINNPANPVLLGGTLTASEARYTGVNETGTVAFVSQTFGGAIRAFDISSKQNPTELGSYWDGEWMEENFAVKGNVVYAPQNSTVRVIDFSNPQNPQKVATLNDVNSICDPIVSVSGDYLLVSYSQNSRPYQQYPNDKFIKIYSIANPRNPQLISTLNVVGNTNGEAAFQMYAAGSLLYLMGAEELTLYIVDISNPGNPSIIGQLTDSNHFGMGVGTFTKGRLAVANGYAYINVGDESGVAALHIVDVRNPMNPTYVRLYNNEWVNGPTQSLRVCNNRLIVSVYGTTAFLDITDPVCPSTLGSTNEGGLGAVSWSVGEIYGQYLVYPSLEGVHVITFPRGSDALQGTVAANANLQ